MRLCCCFPFPGLKRGNKNQSPNRPLLDPSKLEQLSVLKVKDAYNQYVTNQPNKNHQIQAAFTNQDSYKRTNQDFFDDNQEPIAELMNCIIIRITSSSNKVEHNDKLIEKTLNKNLFHSTHFDGLPVITPVSKFMKRVNANNNYYVVAHSSEIKKSDDKTFKIKNYEPLDFSNKEDLPILGNISIEYIGEFKLKISI